jgi:hypothetical protein
MVGCRVGGTGGQRFGCLGRRAGFGWAAQTRDTGKRPKPGHRLVPSLSAGCWSTGLRPAITDRLP